jgi:hypothetical protein
VSDRALIGGVAVAAVAAMAAFVLLFGTWGSEEKGDPLAYLGAPGELFAHDQVVFADGQIISVADIFAGIESADWPKFARMVKKSGGRFERVECEVWHVVVDGVELEMMQRCRPQPLKWENAIAHDFAIEA